MNRFMPLWIVIPLGLFMLVFGLIGAFGVKAEFGPQIMAYSALVVAIGCLIVVIQTTRGPTVV